MNAAMYMGALSGVNLPKADVSRGWQQSFVDASWLAIGAPAPAPLAPATLIGWRQYNPRMPQLLEATGAVSADAREALGADKKGRRGVKRDEYDFIMYFGKVLDPYRKQSDISKVAGGILSVAALAIPALSVAQGISEAGNMAAALAKGNADANLANRAMAPTYAALDAADASAADADFEAQLARIKNLSPAQQAALSAQTQVARPSFTTVEWLLMIAAGGFILRELT